MKLKFITLNVWMGGKLFDNIIAFLKAENPDILHIQEAYNGKDPQAEDRIRTVDEIAKRAGFPYFVFSPAFFDNLPDAKVEQGNAVFSKYPILSNTTTFYDIPYKNTLTSSVENALNLPRILQHAIIELPDKDLNVFNTHGIWGEDGDDNPRRLQMSETIINAVRDKRFTILSGDFNVNHFTKSIKNIEGVLTNIFKDELKSTFNPKHKDFTAGYESAVVDNIFVSRDIKIIDHAMPDVDVSDHMPLVATLEIA